MRRNFLLFQVLPLLLSTAAIKVPVDKHDDNEPDTTNLNETNQTLAEQPIYYSNDEDGVDSYLIPPDPHKLEEVLPDTIVTPATYLLPPSEEQQTGYYYAPTEPGEQSDWYPIAQTVAQKQPVQLLPLKQNVPIPVYFSIINQTKPLKYLQNTRTGKVLNIPVPSLELEPPAENAPNDYIITVPSEELELPAEEIDQAYVQPAGDNQPLKLNIKDVKFHRNAEKPILVSHLTPPKPFLRKYKNPTRLFPKKYIAAFKPVPIPIAQYADDTLINAPKALPAKYFKPSAGVEGDILIPIDEKKQYQYELAEQKKNFQKDSDNSQEEEPVFTDSHNEPLPTEQDASETNYGYPGQNIYAPPAAPIRQRSPTSAPSKKNSQGPPATDDRTEFRMHGMKGPHSYQFGYDTGKGKNRQFRYEERDNDGIVRGHYGYVDKHGKMRVVNYRAHPELGFQAEPQEESKEE